MKQEEITLTITSGMVDDLQDGLAQLGVGVERFETRQLTGAEAVILLVQASAPLIAAVGAEVIRWLRSDERPEKTSRDLTITRPDGSKLSITNATDAQIARAEAHAYEFLAAPLPDASDR